jgi:hypothetical protein
LTTKTVSVNTRQISVNVTSEQIQDLKSVGLISDSIESELARILKEEKRKKK